MKILSWDVGIINLAYCLLEYNDNKYHVIEWGLINLSDKKENKKCLICQKNASQQYYDINDDNYKCFCKTHIKSYQEPKLPEINKFFTIPDSKINCCQCDKIAKRTFNHKNYCSNHGRLFYQKLSKQIKVSTIKKEKNTFDIDKLRFNLVHELDNKPELFIAEKVLIENQPSLKNPRMKSISSTLYDYYLIRGIIDKSFNSQINQVKYMSPSNKIKLSKDNKIVKEADKSQKYKLTKKLAVDYVKALLDNDLNNFKEYFLSVKKKDDLADAFLQGAYYLTTN